MRIAVALFAIVLAFVPLEAAAETIKEIKVERLGSPGAPPPKTSPETIIYIARIDVGDDWNEGMVGDIKTRLNTSGLFKGEANVFSEAMGDGGVRVYLQVDDKHSWIIAPAFYNQPTNVGGGVGYGENNLFGKNQKLLLYGQVATGDTFLIGAWVVPAINDTRLYSQLDLYLRSSRNIEYASPTKYLDDPVAVRQSRIHYFNIGGKLGIELYRGLKLDTRLRAAKVSYLDLELLPGATLANSGIDCGMIDCTNPANIPAPSVDGNDVSSETSLTIDRRASYYGVQEGYRYSASFETSVEGLGSDFRYYLAGVSLFRATKVLDRHNFIVKGQVQYGSRLPFHQELRTGGTSMRGWLNDQFRGNFRAGGNIEYHFPFLGIRLPGVGPMAIRGLLFGDAAYTTFTKTSDNLEARGYLPGAQARGLAPMKTSVGIGTRFFLRDIVLPLLGLDFGYGLESGDYQVYLAIGLTD
ncbi:MAG: BamA/TamA family outer membrane protein [Deltaproteobacteria bacterium]|nr:BamA/TamA family outer membrane protein [Deltaproteobacteria bacterium]MCW5805028.1 BamA/TamA family outer membrane protein [Deltaproteobacteria bacterium]